MSEVIKKVLSFLTCAVLLSACSVPSSDSEDSPSVTDPKQKVATSPLSVIVSTTFEGVNKAVTHGTCYFESTDVAPASKTCTIRIPELVLHFSQIDFAVGSNNSAICAQVSFYPYAYLRTTSNAYTPPGDKDPINCTAGAHKSCWGGAAPKMIDQFPFVGGMYFLPEVDSTITYTLRSSNSYALGGSKDPTLSTNVMVTNNLVDRITSIVSPVSYAGADAFRDYIIQCSDQWGGAMFSIKLIIADNDTKASAAAPVSDEFYDWDN